VEAAFPDEPAWYLVVLGVAPAAQRKGAGSALMRPVLKPPAPEMPR
jgi:ribosomal protein S18 acetylase RimI-like enzyme